VPFSATLSLRPLLSVRICRTGFTVAQNVGCIQSIIATSDIQMFVMKDMKCPEQVVPD